MRWLEDFARNLLAAMVALTLLYLIGPAKPRPAPVPVAAVREAVADSTPALAILYRGEVYRVTDIQLAPDGRTFLAQFRTVKKVKRPPTGSKEE
jgi:hypothetical protein